MESATAIFLDRRNLRAQVIGSVAVVLICLCFIAWVDRETDIAVEFTFLCGPLIAWVAVNMFVRVHQLRIRGTDLILTRLAVEVRLDWKDFRFVKLRGMNRVDLKFQFVPKMVLHRHRYDGDFDQAVRIMLEQSTKCEIPVKARANVLKTWEERTHLRPTMPSARVVRG